MRREIEEFDWNIGAYTYGLPRIHDKGLANLSIGRFCSIGEGVNIALGNHRMDTVSTYPFSQLHDMVQDWSGASGKLDHATKGDVTIGSDVWIATGAFIASGVDIGHGAVVAAESVVTKAVPPYAIVAGNPARLIRYRFGEKTVERLLQTAWWNWKAEKINKCLPLMLSGDVELFLEQA
ncbi:CatB-related O-acetyltransferase [Methylobacterium nonmethylotrophicum]|uniref:CatB-related O-acetyltransferase n=2 Tax=Methylobacterium nonmethylotrophicum TaxID=1141884 RepID=A0A4Z0NS61_9HYPH|nr:CatB-related O-acetyltransferase [Methylobacterium nonmethylotrophicum]